MKNPFTTLSRREWLLWIVSLITVIAANGLSGTLAIVPLIGSTIGVTALIFVAKGDVLGQILTVVFSVLYAMVSWECRYYGEMITYLGMSAPIAALSVVSWLRHPYKKGEREVAVHRLSRRQWGWIVTLAIAVTVLFYFILKAFDTPRLWISTLSVTTSFLASALMYWRSSGYALAYAANDVVLIVLWVLASLDERRYLPMIACFLAFLVNDLYGFISWKRREVRQQAGTAIG